MVHAMQAVFGGRIRLFDSRINDLVTIESRIRGKATPVKRHARPVRSEATEISQDILSACRR
jgi:hypothetical protein